MRNPIHYEILKILFFKLKENKKVKKFSKIFLMNFLTQKTLNE